MNKYQVVMPNGDILGISAELVVDADGSLNFFSNGDKVGEITRWIGWSLVEKVNPPEVPTCAAPRFPAVGGDPYSGRDQ